MGLTRRAWSDTVTQRGFKRWNRAVTRGSEGGGIAYTHSVKSHINN